MTNLPSASVLFFPEKSQSGDRFPLISAPLRFIQKEVQDRCHTCVMKDGIDEASGMVVCGKTGRTSRGCSDYEKF